MSSSPPADASPFASGNSHPDTHYENFPVASRLCPKAIRPAVVALYRFARTADDLADEGTATAQQRLQALGAYRQALQTVCEQEPLPPDLGWMHIMGPLQHAMQRHALPAQPLHDLISAFERDVHHTSTGHVYAGWDELAAYAQLSANPVGRLMLHLYGVDDPVSTAQSDAICTALQYYNFWQDISVDVARGRYYLPLALCKPLGIDPRQPHMASTGSRTALIQALLAHTDELMQQGLPLPRRLLARPQTGWLSALELQLVCQGGWRIGQKTRRLGAAAITERPVLRAGDWLIVLVHALRRQCMG